MNFPPRLRPDGSSISMQSTEDRERFSYNSATADFEIFRAKQQLLHEAARDPSGAHASRVLSAFLDDHIFPDHHGRFNVACAINLLANPMSDAEVEAGDTISSLALWLQSLVYKVGGRDFDGNLTPNMLRDEWYDRDIIEYKAQTRSAQDRLKHEAGERDGWQCFITQLYDHDYAPTNGTKYYGETSCAHILPLALGTYGTENAHQAVSYFTAIRLLFPKVKNFKPQDLNTLQNAVTMSNAFHNAYDGFKLSFKPLLDDPAGLQIVTHRPNVLSFMIMIHAPTEIVHLRPPINGWTPPNRDLFEVHHVLCTINHHLGMHNDRLLPMKEFRALRQLEEDGSTKIPYNADCVVC